MIMECQQHDIDMLDSSAAWCGGGTEGGEQRVGQTDGDSLYCAQFSPHCETSTS